MTGGLLAAGLAIPRAGLHVGLAALFVAITVLVAVGLSTAAGVDRKQGRVHRRLSLYTLTGRQPVKEEESTVLGSNAVARTAVEWAGRVVARRDLETLLARRLELSGLPLRPGEWTLLHVTVAVVTAMVFMLLSAVSLLVTLLGLVLGLALPWAYLSFMERRRTSAFLEQLPDVLTLLAGSLQAGYSLPQAVDAVVREGQQPTSGEFNRALVQARLGMPMEEALDGVARRVGSQDFEWAVMAVRIQRQVGGNLAEILHNVAATIRERERLRRQVSTLSAEGRLSAWILGLLPVAFTAYLALVQPSYLAPLVESSLGLVLVGLAVGLLLVGAFWLSKVVRVDV